MDAQHATRADGPTVLQLSEDERSIVCAIVDLDRGSVGEAFEWATTSAAVEQAMKRAQVHARLMLAAETGRLPLDADALDVIRGMRDDGMDCVSTDRDHLEKLRAGERGHCFVGMTPQETEVEAVRLMDARLDEVNACNSILRRAEAA